MRRVRCLRPLAHTEVIEGGYCPRLPTSRRSAFVAPMPSAPRKATNSRKSKNRASTVASMTIARIPESGCCCGGGSRACDGLSDLTSVAALSTTTILRETMGTSCRRAASAAAASLATPGSDVTPNRSSAVRSRKPRTPAILCSCSRLLRTSASMRSPAATSRCSPRTSLVTWDKVAPIKPLLRSTASAAHSNPSSRPSVAPPAISMRLSVPSMTLGGTRFVEREAWSTEPATVPAIELVSVRASAPCARASADVGGGDGAAQSKIV
mmetsp:Transcript_41719/g.110032  ORF Transcript_41719/g.110032 Transcript_41719/m.110032 type:complete len:267 (+) Transcript_41719:153-953(+)